MVVVVAEWAAAWAAVPNEIEFSGERSESGATRVSPQSVVVASLEEVNFRMNDQVDEAMLLGKAAGPDARTEVL
jgi:hypothetical protein